MNLIMVFDVLLAGDKMSDEVLGGEGGTHYTKCVLISADVPERQAVYRALQQ